MDKVFFGSPFKVIVLAIVLVVIGVIDVTSTQVNAQNWQDEHLLLDMKLGGAELFKEISPSVIHVLQWGFYGGGSGSGYVIDKEGHAITNKHVVGDEKIFEVAFFGDEKTGKRHRAIKIGEDPQLDLAILKIETDPENLHPIKLADSLTIQTGDAVAACGSPGGDPGYLNPGETSKKRFQNEMDMFNFTIGIIDEVMDFPKAHMFYWSRHLRSTDTGQFYGSGVQYLFHMTAAINRGNSGGPTINAFGEAVGTNTWGFFSEENLAFCVPVNLLKRNAREIIEYGHPKTPWFGIVCHPPSPPYKWLAMDEPLKLTNKWNLWFEPEPSKISVYHVNPYSPAYKAGIRENDVIVSVDNKKFKNVFDIYKYFLNGRIGQKMTVMIERKGMQLPPFTVELAEKKVRYDKVNINTWSMWEVRTPYHSELTY